MAVAMFGGVRTTMSGLMVATLWACSLPGLPDEGTDPGCTPFDVAPSDLRRLSRFEYTNTLTELFGATVVTRVSNTIATIPSDTSSHEFDTNQQALHDGHIAAYQRAAEAVAEAVVGDAEVLAAVDPCLTSGAAPDCVVGVLRSFGTRIYRRPLTDVDVDELLAVVTAEASPQDGLRALFSLMLQSPDFLYKLEIDGEPEDGQPGVYRLGPYAVASRLSYLVWGSPPDAELLSRAAEGRLASVDDLERELDRMSADPRARTHGEHFLRQWIGLNFPPSFGQSDEFLDGISTSGLGDAIADELMRFVGHVIWDLDGSYRDLMESRQAYVSSPAVAAIYGVTDLDTWVELPPERAGILTRAGFLAQGSHATSPIKRGIKVRRLLLCEDVPPPDPNLVDPMLIQPPAPDPSMTTRERFTAATAGEVCLGCHRMINPLGFALEDIDPIGRHRTEERIFDPGGQLQNSLPIDATVAPEIGGPDEPTVHGAAELSARIAETEKAQQCFARQWFRYSAGRPDTTADSCTVEQLSGLVRDGSILGVFRGSVNEQLLLRRVEQ